MHSYQFQTKTYHEQLAWLLCSAISYAVRTGTQPDRLQPAVEIAAMCMFAGEVDAK